MTKLVAVFLVLILVGSAAAQGIPQVIRIVPHGPVGVATAVMISVQSEDVRGLAGWDGTFQYDPAAFEYIDSQGGEYIGTAYSVLPLGPVVEPGRVTMGQSSIKGRVGIIARLWLLPLAEGEWEISASDVVLTDIDAQVYTSVTVIPGSIFVGPTPTPTETSTPTPTMTPTATATATFTPTPECVCTFWDGTVIMGCP